MVDRAQEGRDVISRGMEGHRPLEAGRPAHPVVQGLIGAELVAPAPGAGAAGGFRPRTLGVELGRVPGRLQRLDEVDRPVEALAHPDHPQPDQPAEAALAENYTHRRERSPG